MLDNATVRRQRRAGQCQRRQQTPGWPQVSGGRQAPSAARRRCQMAALIQRSVTAAAADALPATVGAAPQLHVGLCDDVKWRPHKSRQHESPNVPRRRSLRACRRCSAGGSMYATSCSRLDHWGVWARACEASQQQGTGRISARLVDGCWTMPLYSRTHHKAVNMTAETTASRSRLAAPLSA